MESIADLSPVGIKIPWPYILINAANLLFLCAIIVLLALSSSATAEEDFPPFRFFSNASYDLNSNMRILEDPTNSLTIDQVASKEHAADFRPSESGILNLGISPSTYWVKLNVIYPSSYPNYDERK